MEDEGHSTGLGYGRNLNFVMEARIRDVLE